MSTDRADAYLTIPVEYGRALGGLLWSHGCDAIEDSYGGTLVLTDQLAAILEGVFASSPVPPLAYVLNTLILFKLGCHRTSLHALNRVRDVYVQAGPAGSGRTAGLLIAELCRGMPPCSVPPTWAELDATLKRRQLFGERYRPELAETPALTRVEFELALAERLSAFDDESLVHWLKHGGPPSAAGKPLADELVQLPAGLGAVLALMQQRPRLVGATAMAPVLDAALTLPPRKPRPDRLPQGGYVDVTTRGDPDRLLPSQFALDPDEFVRRFAERELLYFRREEPHRPTAPERWLVLDQGVRTWGNVRLALTAAVLALLGRDPKRSGDSRLSLTSCAEPFAATEVTPSVLIERLEASDLTPNPADALNRAFAGEAAAPRDIILLTYPRSLRESAVATAARLRGPDDRLFALTVDDAGRAALEEWGPGGPEPIRRFRVDLTVAESAKVVGPAAPAPPEARPIGEWTGDVEPVPFPFRAGLVSDVAHLGFDADADWLVAVGRDGCVQAKHLPSDAPVEVLPRAYRGGEVLTKVDAVLGMTGGVVLCGRIGIQLFVTVSGSDVFSSGASDPTEALAVAHYNFAARTVRLHVLRSPVFRGLWYAFPDLECVALRQLGMKNATTAGFSLDLAMGSEWSPDGFPDTAIAAGTRNQTACYRTEAEPPVPLVLPILSDVAWNASRHAYLKIVRDSIVLNNLSAKEPQIRVRPMSEGKPVLEGASEVRGQLAGDVLAASVLSRKGSRVYLIRKDSGDIIAEFPNTRSGTVMALSRTGRAFAQQKQARAVLVRFTDLGGTVTTIQWAGLHTAISLDLEPHRLRLQVGHYLHAFILNEVPFRYQRSGLNDARRVTHLPAGYGASDLSYDRQRFDDPVRAGPWTAAFDRWGQVVLLGPAGKLVMAILVRRELAAAWLPDGTRWGAAGLLGGSPSPHAVTRIGLALQAASEGHEWT